ncbi:FG-GAP repeat domain-containing protein [Micropruina sp.]|uniref:FG-GAP repeat domain-containing protein n=1 Tax=Micropruina sp. TaxID=2737536 RepID=UPI0039E4CD48
MKLLRVPIALAAAAMALLGLPAPQAIAAPIPAATPDYDGDGKADVAVATDDDSESEFLRIWYGSGRVADILPADLSAGEYGINPALLARDLNGDGYTDLVAATSDSSGAHVHIVPGSAAGLQPVSRHSFVAFGKADERVNALALVESPTPRLAVSFSYHREVRLYPLSSAGLPTGKPIALVPGKGKVPATFKGGDFGRSMAAWGSQLFIGAPDAKVNGKAQAGAVLAVTLDSAGVKSTKTITQATKSVTGAVDKYDYFGRAMVARDGYLVVGTPGDNVDKVKRTGSIQIFTLSSKGTIKPVKRIAQSSAGIPGKAERLDLFGHALAIGTTCNGAPTVLVGGPGEAITKGHEMSDGSAWLIPLRTVKGCGARQIYEGHGLPGKPGYRSIGNLLAFVRNSAETNDDLVIGGAGDYSEGPLGRLYRIAAASGVATKLGADDIIDSVAGR